MSDAKKYIGDIGASRKTTEKSYIDISRETPRVRDMEPPSKEPADRKCIRHDRSEGGPAEK